MKLVISKLQLKGRYFEIFCHIVISIGKMVKVQMASVDEC